MSPTSAVYQMLATNEGRAKFWAESAVEVDGKIHFIFPNGQSWLGRLIEHVPPQRLGVQYLGGSVATFRLEDDGHGGTDLTLTDEGFSEEEAEVLSGWVSVLLALKAAVDHGVDLRNHDEGRTWDEGFVDN
ncbi:MAG: SRPBCC domain-containing protein [Pyrinomonadaceae bacterium]|nr:SRPBCC domain-containing protein [Pyrinomonadaceae bacterium]